VSLLISTVLTMPRDLLSLAAAQAFHCSGKARSCSKPGSCRACRATAVGITILMLVMFCSCSALADDFGLGPAGPGNFTVLETGNTPNSEVQFSGNAGITGGSAPAAANLGIASGGRLNAGGNPNVVAGTYYRFSTNTNDTTNGNFTAVGGTNTTSDSLLSSAAASASAASLNLAGSAANQTFPNPSNTNLTINATVAGRNVISFVGGANLNNNVLTLNANGQANVSFVINVSGNLTMGAVNLIGVSPANVIFNVTGTGNNISLQNNPPAPGFNGIFMDIGGNVSTATGTLNGEIISGVNIQLNNGFDAQAIETVPESSTVAYFTFGPLSLVAVMLLHRRFSRRKQAVVGRSHDPPESVLDVVKSG